MKIRPRRNTAAALAAVVALLLAAPVVLAQEEDEEDDGIGNFYVEMGTWVAQATGLEFQASTRQSATEPFGTEILGPERGTSTELRYRVGYELPKKLGRIVVTAFEHEDDDLTFTASDPGRFVFGETMTVPLHAGFANDGLADRVDYTARNVLRDLRIDFEREAFRTARARGRWFIGFRRTQHSRAQEAEYSAVVPELPPLIPPAVSSDRPDLLPNSDTAFMESRYEGRGLEAGMAVEMPLWQDKIVLEAGFAVAALRGDMDTRYRSTTSFYTIQFPEDESPTILTAPYVDTFSGSRPDPTDPTSTQAFIDFILQQQLDIGLQDTEGRERAADVLETWLTIRYKVWRELEILGGFRQAHYTGVGLDLRPVVFASTEGVVNVQSVEETDRSATYEGFYLGAAIRF